MVHTMDNDAFRLLFHNSPDAIWLLDVERRTFVDCNDAAVAMMRAQDKSVLLRLKPSDLSPEFQPDGRRSSEKEIAIIRQVETQGGARFEWLARRLDGEPLTVEVVTTAVLYAGRAHHVAVCRDIGERKQTEAALRESQQLLASIADNISEAVYRSSPEHGLMFVNRAYLKMFGHDSLEDLRRVPREQLYANPADRKRLLAMLEGGGEIRNEEVEYRRKDGATFWALSSSTGIFDAATRRLVYHVGTITDITARKRIEAELRASEQRWRLLFEQSPLSIQVFAPDGWSRRVNAAWKQLFCVTEADALRFNILEDPQLQASGSIDLIRRAFAGEVTLVPPRPFVVHPTACDCAPMEKWIGAIMFPLLDDRGRVLEVVCIHEDITERKKNETRAQQLQQELETRVRERTRELVVANEQLQNEVAERRHTEGLLRESEARARTLVEHAPEAIVVFDGKSGRFLACNENAVRLYGLPRAELLKIGPAEVSPLAQPNGRLSVDAARDYIQLALAGEAPVFEWMHRHASGRLIPCEVRLVRLPAEGQDLVRGSVIDNTERHRRQKVQQAIYQISEAVHEAPDLARLYRRVHATVHSLMPADNFYIALLDPVSELFNFPYFVDERDPAPAPMKLTTGLTGYVIRTGKPLLVTRDTVRREPDAHIGIIRNGSEESVYLEAGTPSAVWLGAPLNLGGKTIGVVALQDYRDENAYGEEEKQILTFVAGQIALAIERKQAEQALRTRSDQILRHRNVLLELAQLDKSDLETAVRVICRSAATTLNVERVGYWSLNDHDTTLVCEALYLAAHRDIAPAAKGTRVQSADCPAYFQALSTQQPIIADNARTHPATRELAASYLEPLGITSMLDAPVWVHGRVVGVLCHEHIGTPREWTQEEIGFMSSLATMVSLSIEAAQRARSEKALRESEQKFRALFEASSQGVMLHDEEKFLEVNPATLRIMGYRSASEVIGRSPAEMSPPTQPGGKDSAALAGKYIAECMANGSARFDWVSRTAAGNDIPLEVILTRIPMGGRPIIQAVINDISERKKAEAELRERESRLRESEARFSAAFHGSPVLISVVRMSDGCFVEVNDAFLGWIGTDRNEVVGRTSAELGMWATAAEREGFWRELRNQTSLRNLERQVRNRHGAVHTMLLSADIIEINTVAHALIVGLDITERKQVETELLKTLAREKELGQLKSDFVSLVSHEFRTPLGVILSSAEILESYFEQLDAAERRDHLQSIQKSTRRMAGLMEEVLVLSQAEAGKMDFKPVPLNLENFSQRLVDEVLSATDRKCPIRLRAASLPGEARADERLLRHIFTNLLTNAVKYSPAGSAVDYEIDRDGAEAVCRIVDRGIGIPEADHARLFSAFHRGRNVGHEPGTGLGLTIVKRCVDLHRGAIKVESAVGAGTTITVRLPVFAKPS